MPRSRKYRSRRKSRVYRRHNTRRFARKVKRVLYRAAETKQASTGIVNYTEGSAIKLWQLVPAISQGARDDNRIGNRIRAINYQVKITIEAIPNQTVKARLYIIWPKYNYNQTGTYVTTSNYPLDLLVEQDMTVVWKDTQFVLSNPPTIGYPVNKRIIFNKKFHNSIDYDGASSTQAVKGPLLIIVSPYAGTGTYRVNGYIKMSYKDI